MGTKLRREVVKERVKVVLIGGSQRMGLQNDIDVDVENPFITLYLHLRRRHSTTTSAPTRMQSDGMIAQHLNRH
ncbi:hypothetical protein BHM03_00001560 [Ensete ventricosum]|nr:hypothetical protein BHM03_00001560 [Ensete ventricosum]